MMTLTIEIPSEMESQLRRLSGPAQGMDVTVFVAKTLEARLGGSTNGEKIASLGKKRICWRKSIPRFRPRRCTVTGTWWPAGRRNTLTPAEHEELIQLSDGIELANAARVAHVIELARLRRVPVDTLIQQLGIPLPAAGTDESATGVAPTEPK